MRKIFALVLVFCLMMGVVSAASAATSDKIQAYINVLKGKLAQAESMRDFARQARLKAMIEEQASRLQMVEGGAEDYSSAGETASSDVEELREEVTDAIAALNSKIVGVEKKTDKGAAVAGRAYIYWNLKDLTSSPTYNKMDISRMYLDFKKNLAKDCKVRFTTDIARETYDQAAGTDDDTRVHVYMKYAYYEMGNLGTHWNLPVVGLQSLTIGQSATHWIDFMQKYWKFRYVLKTLTDNYSLFSSADFGIAAKGLLKFADLGIPGINNVEYHGILMNGSGYKSAENNAGKDIGLTLKMKPVAWGKKDYVTIAAGGLIEDMGLTSFNFSDCTKKLSAMGAYNFTKPIKGILFAEYANQLESETGGIAVGGHVQVAPDTNLFGRVDSYNKSGDQYSQQIVGVEYNWGKNVKLALDYHLETKNSAEDTAQVAIHTRVKW